MRDFVLVICLTKGCPYCVEFKKLVPSFVSTLRKLYPRSMVVIANWDVQTRSLHNSKMQIPRACSAFVTGHFPDMIIVEKNTWKLAMSGENVSFAGNAESWRGEHDRQGRLIPGPKGHPLVKSSPPDKLSWVAAFAAGAGNAAPRGAQAPENKPTRPLTTPEFASLWRKGVFEMS